MSSSTTRNCQTACYPILRCSLTRMNPGPCVIFVTVKWRRWRMSRSGAAAEPQRGAAAAPVRCPPLGRPASCSGPEASAAARAMLQWPATRIAPSLRLAVKRTRGVWSNSWRSAKRSRGFRCKVSSRPDCGCRQSATLHHEQGTQGYVRKAAVCVVGAARGRPGAGFGKRCCCTAAMGSVSRMRQAGRNGFSAMGSVSFKGAAGAAAAWARRGSVECGSPHQQGAAAGRPSRAQLRLMLSEGLERGAAAPHFLVPRARKGGPAATRTARHGTGGRRLRHRTRMQSESESDPEGICCNGEKMLQQDVVYPLHGTRPGTDLPRLRPASVPGRVPCKPRLPPSSRAGSRTPPATPSLPCSH
jgi:hypothetical protein